MYKMMSMCISNDNIKNILQFESEFQNIDLNIYIMAAQIHNNNNIAEYLKKLQNSFKYATLIKLYNNIINAMNHNNDLNKFIQDIKCIVATNEELICNLIYKSLIQQKYNYVEFLFEFVINKYDECLNIIINTKNSNELNQLLNKIKNNRINKFNLINKYKLTHDNYNRANELYDIIYQRIYNNEEIITLYNELKFIANININNILSIIFGIALKNRFDDVIFLFQFIDKMHQEDCIQYIIKASERNKINIDNVLLELKSQYIL